MTGNNDWSQEARYARLKAVCLAAPTKPDVMFRDFFAAQIATYEQFLENRWVAHSARAVTRRLNPDYTPPPPDHAFVITTLALALLPDCFSPSSWQHKLICPNDLRDRNPVAFAADHLVRVFSQGEDLHSVAIQHNRALHFIYLIAFNTRIWCVALRKQKVGSAVVKLFQDERQQSWDQVVLLCLDKAKQLKIVAALEPDKTTGEDEATGQVGVSLAEALERAKANARQSYPSLLERYVLPEFKGRTETRQSVERLAELCEPFAAAARGDFGVVPREVRHRLQDVLKAKKTQKRGGGTVHVSLDEPAYKEDTGPEADTKHDKIEDTSEIAPDHLLDYQLFLDNVEARLGKPIRAVVASLLNDPDLTQEERAKALGVSDRTIRNHLKLLKEKLPPDLKEFLR